MSDRGFCPGCSVACPECGGGMVWVSTSARKRSTAKRYRYVDNFKCPHCGAEAHRAYKMRAGHVERPEYWT